MSYANSPRARRAHIDAYQGKSTKVAQCIAADAYPYGASMHVAIALARSWGYVITAYMGVPHDVGFWCVEVADRTTGEPRGYRSIDVKKRTCSTTPADVVAGLMSQRRPTRGQKP